MFGTTSPRHGRADEGYTLIEIMVVVAVVGILAAMAVPSTRSMMGGYRLKTDAESVNNLVALAKMRASATYSRARVYADLTARTYRLETWNKTTSSWTIEGGTTSLSSGVSFGYGSLAAPPPNTQAAIGQSAVCTDDSGADVNDTACITFSSRGMPVTNVQPPGGGVTGNSAIYLTDGVNVYGTTITTTPLIKFWWARDASGATWVRQ